MKKIREVPVRTADPNSLRCGMPNLPTSTVSLASVGVAYG